MKTLARIAAAILFILSVTAVTAHEVPNVEVNCPTKTATAHGIKFAEHLPITVTVTGPSFSTSFVVTTDEWTVTFPIGGNGAYLMTWPNAGQFERHFNVECGDASPSQSPSPTPKPSSTPRPTPRLTPPPTDTE